MFADGRGPLHAASRFLQNFTLTLKGLIIETAMPAMGAKVLHDEQLRPLLRENFAQSRHSAG